ncbi:MAG: class I SAM-dependent methyltransferase [Candidatus Sumerlaeota bacterium]|nr:class I SAM-dependent methyltransferase [Candidatus Sumerlaeota bacterium]
MPSPTRSYWYETAFDTLYLTLYPHRDEADARRAVEFLDKKARLGEARLVLDLCCGAGRHLLLLRHLGARVVGFDLSRQLLETAANDLAAHDFPPSLVQGDMAHLPFSGAFDLAINLFTSFGYFDSDAENARVLREAAEALKRGGRFVLDFMNAPWVRASLVPHSVEQTATRLRVDTRRAIEGDPPRVVKRVRVSGGRVEREIVESVRLFERADLEAMLSEAGLRVAGAWGDFDGRPYGEMAPRCLLLAEKSS